MSDEKNGDKIEILECSGCLRAVAHNVSHLGMINIDSCLVKVPCSSNDDESVDNGKENRGLRPSLVVDLAGSDHDMEDWFALPRDCIRNEAVLVTDLNLAINSKFASVKCAHCDKLVAMFGESKGSEDGASDSICSIIKRSSVRRSEIASPPTQVITVKDCGFVMPDPKKFALALRSIKDNSSVTSKVKPNDTDGEKDLNLSKLRKKVLPLTESDIDNRFKSDNVKDFSESRLVETVKAVTDVEMSKVKYAILALNDRLNTLMKGLLQDYGEINSVPSVKRFKVDKSGAAV